MDEGMYYGYVHYIVYICVYGSAVRIGGGSGLSPTVWKSSPAEGLSSGGMSVPVAARPSSGSKGNDDVTSNRPEMRGLRAGVHVWLGKLY